MPVILKDVFTKIFSSIGDAKRQVIAVSRSVAEKIPFVESVAVISITQPGKPLASLAEFQHILRLSFADVDFLDENLSKRAAEKLPNAFTPKQAQAVRSFVETLPEEIATIIVHCEGGFSRSCAIALALHQLYGFSVDHERLDQANPSVLKVMREEKSGGMKARGRPGI